MDLDRLTPVEVARRRNKRIRWTIILLVLIGVVYYAVFEKTYVVAYDSDLEHFKYGSIGSETASGVPYWIFQALPVLFEDKLGPGGYKSFGFLYEPGQDLPIGVSRRVVQGIERVWLNCAVCHTGTYRENDGDESKLIIGAPANNLRLFEFIQFLREAAIDNRFSADNVLQAIEQAGGDLGWFRRFIYRTFVVKRVGDGLLELRQQLAFMERQHDWGPGRVDTFNPYKAIQFNFPMGPEYIGDKALNGASDYPSIWQQRPREGMQLHWDGNNTSVAERNLSAALGAGVTPVTVDRPSIQRIERWLSDWPAPAYPKRDQLDAASIRHGKRLYGEYCASCHGAMSAKGDGYDYDTRRYSGLGKVVPLRLIGTDPGRVLSYTEGFAGAQNMLYAGYPWRFQQFRKTEGYANQPLDGIWARSPYLHNGSVPTLRDLLEPADKRPAVFYRGSDVFDWKRVGYKSIGGGSAFRFDTALPGNSNEGHDGPRYGTALSERDKVALVEYMKTF